MKPDIAVVLAAGNSNRMGGSLPKQFLELGGKTILEHAVDAFEANGNIHGIAIVSHPAWLEETERIATRNRWQKLQKILPGGKERHHSSLSAIDAYRSEEVNLIFHDAARPLVSRRIIDEVASALLHHQAVDVAIPCTDTVLQVKDGFIEHVPDRRTLMRSQTPQAFDAGLIAKAYDLALRDKDFSCTDDCGVLLRYLPGTPVFIVQGDERNLKLTRPQDLKLLEILLNGQTEDLGLPSGNGTGRSA